MSELDFWLEHKATKLKDLIQYEKEMREEIKELLGRVKVIKAEQEAIKKQLIDKMETLGEKFKFTKNFKIQCTLARYKVVIKDEEVIPRTYYDVSYTLNKERLLKDRGEGIPGVEFTRSKSMIVTKL